MPIRTLPPLVVNQIAAGEVVERPASVVKELIENAIDAGATRIEVAIENGGRNLIQVSDNGAGIPFDELTLAIASHATSKITTTEDLDAIGSLGFRGEALASIASVSRLSLISRPAEAANAGRIDAEGDRVEPPRPESGSPGTTVTVRNLFFNTPARRKFLRTDQTEAARITETIERLAMPHPQIGFRLRKHDRLSIDWPPHDSASQRTLAVVGEELAEELLAVQMSDRGIKILGRVGTPAIARGTARHMQVFLNGRYITDRSINHAIKEAYRGLIEPGRYPTAILFLEVDPETVDVNVHPTKAEVRFRNHGSIHGAVMTAVRERLREADLTPALELTAVDNRRPALQRLQAPAFGSGLAPVGATATDSSTGADAFVEYFRRLDPTQKGFVYSEMKEALATEAPELLEQADAVEDEIDRARADRDIEILPTIRQVENVLQVHSSFIVTQDEQGLVIIDQHALHERVMFEQLKRALGTGNLESQRLLMPATVELDRSHIERLEDLQPLLMRIGIDADRIGPTSIGINAFSSFLFERNVEPPEFISELFDRAAEHALSDDPEAALHEVLDMMACKAAVKAGDRLSQTELSELLKQRHLVERASNCPHGRPTTLRLSIEELERQFGRR